jgi:hypothetical protein
MAIIQKAFGGVSLPIATVQLILRLPTFEVLANKHLGVELRATVHLVTFDRSQLLNQEISIRLNRYVERLCENKANCIESLCTKDAFYSNES